MSLLLRRSRLFHRLLYCCFRQGTVSSMLLMGWWTGEVYINVDA